MGRRSFPDTYGDIYPQTDASFFANVGSPTLAFPFPQADFDANPDAGTDGNAHLNAANPDTGTYGNAYLNTGPWDRYAIGYPF